MIQPKLYLGPPGCGKTTRLLKIIAEEISLGVRMSEIAFVTFTKRGVEEGITRVAEKFGMNPREAHKEFPWFRTIHSLAYAQLGIMREEVMQPSDWKEFSNYVGYNVSGHADLDGPIGFNTQQEGDQMLRLVDYAATTGTSLHDAWHELGTLLGWHEVEHFANSFAYYKNESGKLDFTDMIVRYATQGNEVPVRVAVIDEAQDLTAMQWQAVRRAFGSAERVYVAGDDDQSIYKWAGSDIEQFLKLSEYPETLSQSYRLPRKIQAYSQQIANRISHRYPKQFAPRQAEGVLEFHADMDEIDFGEGTWLVLARNSYQLGYAEQIMRERGYLYSTRRGPSMAPAHIAAMYLWENLRSGKVTTFNVKEAKALAAAIAFELPPLKDAAELTIDVLGLSGAVLPVWHEMFTGIDSDTREYAIACLRSKEKLRAAPRIRLETIHAVKGAEEQHVVLLSDLSAKSHRGLELDPDSEHRVFYVGVTRAKESLHIIEPQTDRYYDFPPAG